ncbi:hypothetical protein AAGT13_20795 [Azotobacter salinestris]
MPTENQSAPRERPILFSAPMVRAILEGRKTVTRREAKNIQPSPLFRSGWKAERKDGRGAVDITAPAGLLGELCP